MKQSNNETMEQSNNKLLYYLSFSYFLGIGPMRLKALMEYFGGVKKAYNAKEKEIKMVIGVNIARKFIEFRANFDPVKKMEELKKKNIKVLCLVDKDYPESLRNISDPPICIYLKSSMPNFFSSVGVLASLRTSQVAKNSTSSLLFAIVGTRKPTSYGQQVARKFAYELSEAGFVIVSGMAMGIDTVAHQGALAAGGKTIAVLGCGVNVIYPAINRNLYEKIIKTGGAVLSEFPPDQLVLKGLFIARNRIISGLSRGVMIVEGLKDSGALITARFAAEQGKEVFAPPNPITSEMSQAPNLLLKQGAKLVTSLEDILEEFNLKITPKKKEDIRKKLTGTGKIVLDILQENPQTIDELAVNLDKPVTEILNTISLMEIEGIVEKNNENCYQVKLQ